jgi:hypothetical protein
MPGTHKSMMRDACGAPHGGVNPTPTVHFWPKTLVLVIILNDSNVPKIASNSSIINGGYGAVAASDLVSDQ